MPRPFHTPTCLGFLSTATFGLVQFLVIAFYPALAEATGLPVPQIVMCFTVGTLLFLWGSPYWAAKSDRVGRVRVLRLGLAGLTTSFALLLALTAVPMSSAAAAALLLASRVLYGLTASAIPSVVQAWWRDQEGDATRHMLTHSMGLNLGRMLAPLMVLALAGELRPVLGAVLAASGLLAVSAFLGNERGERRVSEKGAVVDAFPPMALALLATMFIGLVHATLATHLQHAFGLGARAGALMMAQVLLASGILVLLLQSLLKKLPRLSPARLLVAALPSWIIATFLLADTTRSLWPAVFFLSVGIATVAPAYLALMPAGGKSSGRLGAVQTLGLAAGSGWGSVVLSGSAPLDWSLYSLCAGLALAAALALRPKEGHAC